MSTFALRKRPTGPVVSPEDLLFDYPGADVILRSCDSYEFRVLKIYLFHSSPVLGEQVLAADNPQSISSTADVATASLPAVQLSDSGASLLSLLTYIFPVPPILPSTVEQIMELLSVAQKYKMDTTLTHIRNHVSQQPPFIRVENSLYVYSLAQRHGLREEMLQAARSTLALPSLTIDDLGEKLELMPGVFLHELWKYHRRVSEQLMSDLPDFAESRALAMFRDCTCPNFAYRFSSWLRQYILSIGRNPHLFDLSRFYDKLTGHIQWESSSQCGGCNACARIFGKTIPEFWAAFSVVYNDSITKAESDLRILLVEEETSPDPPSGCTSQPRYTDMPDANVILRSSDLVNFRVHRSILAMSSPFFEDLFSLPQPSDREVVGDLPVVDLPEDSEVLNSLVAMLYPVPPEIPNSADKILTLLAACQKYDMTIVQSSIRAEVNRRRLLSPAGAESFRVFAIACRKRLIPEMKAAARLTLSHPLTFEYLGEALGSFEGWALLDLYLFHQCWKDSVTSCLVNFFNSDSGPSEIWLNCRYSILTFGELTDTLFYSIRLPIWFCDIFLLDSEEGSDPHTLLLQVAKRSSFRKEYLEALRGHISEIKCSFCMETHILKGEEYCLDLENRLAQARDVQYSFRIELPESKSVSSPSLAS